MKNFKKFLKDNKIVFIFTFIISVFIYLFYFNNIISIDTEIFINNREDLLKSWIGINRFSLVLFKSILNVPFNILISRIITFIIFNLSCIMYSYIFSKWSNIKDKKVIFLMIVLMLSSPIFAEQFGFTLQSVEMSLGLFLFSLIFISLDNYNESNNKIYMILACIFSIITFGLYQAFIILFITMSLFCILTNHSKIKDIIVLFFISFLIYFIISFIFKNCIYNVKSSYLTNSFNWFNQNFLTNVLRIGYFGIYNLFGINLYTSVVYLIMYIIGIVSLIKVKEYKNLIIYILLGIMPYVLIILTASNTAYRAQFSYIFVLIIMFIYLLKYVDKKYLFILIIIPLLKQTLVSSILISNDYQRYNKDLELVNYIKTNINDNNKKIIFVGRFNNGIKIKGETLGNSFAEWDYYTEIGVNGRLNGLLKTQGINNINPSDIEYNLAINYDLIQSSDIINLDNYIYINLDNIKV